MHALRDLQWRFADGLVGRDASRLRARIAGRPAIATDRFAVYANNFYVSLIDALAAVYPVVQRLVGEACFRSVARRYVGVQPSTSGDLHAFGHAFPTHLASRPELSGLPYLADVARLEWAWHRAFHAADATPSPRLEALAGLGEPQFADVHFELHPSCQLLRSVYPVLRIWEANRDPELEPQPISLDEGGIDLLLLRPRLEIELRPIAAAEYDFLAAIGDDLSLPAAAEVAFARDPDFDLTRSLANFVRSGVLLRWRIGARPDPACPSRHESPNVHYL